MRSTLTPGRSARWRAGLLGGLAVGSAGFVGWAATAGLDVSVAVATLGGLLISAASLVVAILQMFPVVRRSRVNVTAAAAALGDDIRDQWLGEAGARSIRDTAILPVTWTVAASEIADREQPAHPWAAVGRGRLDGDFDTAAAEIATEYRRVGNGRLVILGQPGVGKTVIAMLLTVGLLPNRSSEANHPPPSRDNPVPVLLSASSWDPICEPLDDWIVRTVALSHFNGETTVPRLLLDERLLLPVVDGLDEIPESARRTAVHRINRAIDTNRPIVVTCRTAEFEDVIRGGAPVLHRSPVIQVMPVSPADAVDYLRRVVDDPNREGWQRIYDTVRHAPDSPLAEALSTPLMLSILVAVYGDARARPEELLDAATYHSRHAIEDHLLDHAITARFAGPGIGRYRCDAEQATRWLTFLATYLHRHRERDLAWWRMSDRLLPQLVVPAIGLLLGLVLMMVGALVARPLIVLSSGKEDIEAALGIGAFTGGAFAVLFLLTWYAVPTRLPGRLSWSPAGSWRRVRRSLLIGFAILIMPGVAVLVAVLATLPLVDNWTYPAIYSIAASGVLVAAAGCVLGFGLAADAWLSAPPERSTQPSPAGFLLHDRRSALVGAAAAALAVAATIPPLEMVSSLLGDWIAHAVAAHAGVGPRPDGVKVLDPSSELDSDWVSRGSVVVVPGVAVGLLVLLTRAWPRFLVARAYLAVRGQLPWRLPAFLAEARARGLLRESGGMYQFHHVRLQERLASRPAAEAPPVSAASAPETLPWSHRRRKALLAAGTALIILVAATATILDAPPRVTLIRLQPPTIGDPSSYSREVGLSRDGSVLVVARDDVLDVWHLDLEAGYGRYAGFRLPESFPDRAQAVAVSSSGDRIAVATETAVFLLGADSTSIRQWNLPEVKALAFAPSDEMLATYEDDGPIRILPTKENGPETTLDDHLTVSAVLAFRPGEPAGTLATVVGRQVGHAANPDTESAESPAISLRAPNHIPQHWKNEHTSTVTAMIFTDDATTLVTGSSDSTIRFPTGMGLAARPPLTSSRLDSIDALALPDGTTNRIVAADSYSVELWTTS